MADRSRSILCPHLLPLACLTALCGCVQGPDYVKPEVAVPGAYRTGNVPTENAAPVDESEWWGQFQDAYLAGLVDEALANNRNLTIASARVL